MFCLRLDVCLLLSDVFDTVFVIYQSTVLFFLLTLLQVSCGFNITNMQHGEAIEVLSPNHPYFYPDRLECTWVFTAEDQTGSFVIHFLTFDTQPRNDPLKIGIGNTTSSKTIIKTLFATIPSNVVAVLEEAAIWIHFTSDFTRSRRGFHLKIERLNVSGTSYMSHA